jgi:predicted transcriptional regulator
MNYNIMTEVEFFSLDIDLNSYSHRQLEEIANVGEGTIRYWLKKRGIKKQPKSPNTKKISRDGEVEKLVSEGYSTKQIAKLLGFGVRQITCYKYANNLESSRFGKLDFTEEEEQVIIGSLLGDGSIIKTNYREGYYALTVTHGIKQQAYIEYKAKLLNRLTKTVYANKRLDKRFKTLEYTTLYFVTTPHPSYEYFRKNWYKEKKIIYRDDFKKLSPLGLAIWFMDDGCKIGNSISLATDCFNMEDLNFMQSELIAKWGLHFYIHNKKLDLAAADYDTFYDLINPYIIPTMRYKLPEYKRKHKRYRPVIQTDLQGNIIKLWPTAASPTIEMGLKSRAAIFNACKRGHLVKGFKWEFVTTDSSKNQLLHTI